MQISKNDRPVENERDIYKNKSVKTIKFDMGNQDENLNRFDLSRLRALNFRSDK